MSGEATRRRSSDFDASRRARSRPRRATRRADAAGDAKVELIRRRQQELRRVLVVVELRRHDVPGDGGDDRARQRDVAGRPRTTGAAPAAAACPRARPRWNAGSRVDVASPTRARAAATTGRISPSTSRAVHARRRRCSGACGSSTSPSRSRSRRRRQLWKPPAERSQRDRRERRRRRRTSAARSGFRSGLANVTMLPAWKLRTSSFKRRPPVARRGRTANRDRRPTRARPPLTCPTVASCDRRAGRRRRPPFVPHARAERERAPAASTRPAPRPPRSRRAVCEPVVDAGLTSVKSAGAARRERRAR